MTAFTNGHAERKLAVYAIHNLEDGRLYVGSTTQWWPKRLAQHFYLLRKRAHSNRYLQAAWNKYGERAFFCECVADGLLGSRSLIEGRYIALLHASVNDGGYNLTDAAECSLKLSAEVRAKMSASHTGKPRPELRGRIVSDETRLRLSLAHRGRPAPNKGKPHSEERRRKISEAGRGRAQSAETRAKRAATLLGHRVSRETAAKISAANRGRIVTPEARANMSRAQTLRWERIRARLQSERV